MKRQWLAGLHTVHFGHLWKDYIRSGTPRQWIIGISIN